MAFMDLLNKTCTIRAKAVDTSTHPHTTINSTVSTGTPLALQPASAREVEIYGKRSTMISHVAYFLPTVTIAESYDVVVGSTTYRVQGVVDDGGRAHHTKVYLLEERLSS